MYAIRSYYVRESLAAGGAGFELIEIDPDYADTAAFCEKYGYPEDHSANAIVVASKKPPGEFCACLVLATTRLDVNVITSYSIHYTKLYD